jgi:hypothetical protein
MGGYISPGNGGTTELRIHGVSGTPPQVMLCHPEVRQVAGDRTAGFHRRWWPVRPEPRKEYDGDSADTRQEAYSWGGLTAGSRLRALWLLLLPFMLANLAFFMVPYPPTDRRGQGRWLPRKTGEALQRVFSLALTCVLVLAAGSVTMDLVAWQCTRPGPANCADNLSWLGFLTEGPFTRPSRRLALAALVPLAAVGLLWRLSHSTWLRYEDRLPPARAAAPPGPVAALENRKLWNGAEPVSRLRAVHVTAGLALTGVLLVAPLTGGDGWSRGPLRLLHAALLGLLVVAGVLAALPATAARREPGSSALTLGQRWMYRVLPWLTLALVTAGLVVALFPGVGPGSTAPAGGTRVLPWYSAMLTSVVIVLAVTWALVALLTMGLALSSRRAGSAPRRGADLPVERAWWGMGTPVVLMIAWLVAAGFAAGLSLEVAKLLGEPVPAGHEAPVAVPLSLPPFYFWTAVGAGAALLLLLVAVLLGAAGFGLRYLDERAKVVRDTYACRFPHGYAEAPADDRRRARAIARARAVAGTAEIGRVLVGVLTLVICALLFCGLVAYLVPGWRDAVEQAVPGPVVGWCVALITLGTLTLLALGRAAYQDRNKRRTLGMLWDVGTFWPRATHPLAPPSYGERAMPDLVARVAHLTRGEGDVVVLSGHSQGSVIAAAAVLQLDAEQRARVCLLTYGCPLRRLYSRFFPGYFGLDTLQRVGSALCETRHPTPERSLWPWRNLYRRTDYIGGPVFAEYRAVDADPPAGPAAGDNNDVDRELLDPRFARAAGDLAWPATFGHSDYWSDPAFAASLALVIRLHRSRSRSRSRTEAEAEAEADGGLVGAPDL